MDNININRNSAQTLTWAIKGDYSSDTVKFTVKEDDSVTSTRKIDVSASVSYAGSVSTITVTLEPSHSASLTQSVYKYDLRVENDEDDREPLFIGNAYLNKSIRNDTDSATISDTDNVLTLNADDFENDDLIGKKDGSVTGLSVNEVKTLLGIDKYLGIKTESEMNALVTSSYSGGEKVTVVDPSGLTREFIWNNYTEEWV